jgi:uncharacterized protein YeaO (DUF488 family)
MNPLPGNRRPDPPRLPDMNRLRIKRIYDEPWASDGTRVLVDRLWPRGLSKAQARIDVWLKDVAPSGQLRKWYGHDVKRWDEFKRRYFKELSVHEEPVTQIRKLVNENTVTLLYSARSETHNNAVALVEFLKRPTVPD